MNDKSEPLQFQVLREYLYKVLDRWKSASDIHKIPASIHLPTCNVVRCR